MGRLCERPGCSQPADVTYGIDTDHLTVWIEPFDGAVGFRAGVLCRRHADAMVVPLGWMLDDRREAVPRLFKPREPQPAPKVRHKRARAQAARDETGQLELGSAGTSSSAPAEETAVPVGSADAAPEPGVDTAAPASPWKPIFDHHDDLGGLLQAQSPLLSRAFGKRDRTPPS